MTLRLLVSVLYCLFAAHAAAEKIRTITPRATLNYLSVPVAEVKGFFHDEGLENETIVIPGSTWIAALVSGEGDYSGAGRECSVLYCLFAAHASAEKIRTITPRATLNYLSVPVAEVKGFFHDEGLENETIVI